MDKLKKGENYWYITMTSLGHMSSLRIKSECYDTNQNIDNYLWFKTEEDAIEFLLELKRLICDKNNFWTFLKENPKWKNEILIDGKRYYDNNFDTIHIEE